MSKAKHTPGPWKVFHTTDGRKIIGVGETTGEGITDCGFGVWRSGDELEANARLIAAAPDLLESLEIIASWDEARHKLAGEHQASLIDIIDSITAHARRTIAKATG